MGWTYHIVPAHSPDNAFDPTIRLGRARIAADTLRSAIALPAKRPPLREPVEALPTIHITLRRLLTLGCAFALGLAIWAAWRGWHAARPGLARHSLALLGGGLWLLAAGLTVARGLGPELPLDLAVRIGLAPGPLNGEPDAVAPAERADLTLAEAQDRQRLVRLVLTHWAGYLPPAPREAAEWRTLVAEPVVGLPVGPAQAASDAPPETRWRRALWDNLYPSIRQVATPAQAARSAAWHLRLQVRLDSPSATASASATEAAAPARWFDAWRARHVSPAQFEYLLVAGLRSVGLPARLRPDGRAEHRVGSEWQLVWFDERAAAHEAPASVPPAPLP